MAGKKTQPGKEPEERKREIHKTKDVEKDWRKGDVRWKYSGDSEADNNTLVKKRSAPPRHQIVKPGVEHDALVLQTGGPLVILLDGDTEIKAKFRRSTTTKNEKASLIAIGDVVRYMSAEDGEAVITHVHERVSSLSRSSILNAELEQIVVANIDQIAIVSAATDEMLKPGLIDRYLIAAAMGGLHAFVVINKIDLLDEDGRSVLQEIVEQYEEAGYYIVVTSCKTGEGMEALRSVLLGKLSAFAGHSGVGKTSLLNTLIPAAKQKTQVISGQSGRGIHTTTKNTLFQLPDGGYIADTPGVREFGLYYFEKNDLHTYYPEFVRFNKTCKYPFCTHTHEPFCGVKDAIEQGMISELRYRNYLQIMESEEERTGIS
jgi:ribosome biogenesis GTPase / thiamine phosphate phosphatase